VQRTDRDPRQLGLRAFLAPSSLTWVIRHRAWTPFHLVRYWRFLVLKVRHPEVVTEGFVYLGRRVELSARRGYGRIVLGRWVHLGEGTRLRAHEGTLRVGDKAVFGRDNTVNCYLDIEFGARTLVADWVYVCDFDHRFDDLAVPIKDQGIVKTPVRIGPDCWLGTKVSVLRGTRIGRGTVLGAHAVARGEIPEYSIAVGAPARVVRDRMADYRAATAHRAALADIARKTAAAVQARLGATESM
jgi:acetyltransferase-like isoleucine patch superfamily enzyme